MLSQFDQIYLCFTQLFSPKHVNRLWCKIAVLVFFFFHIVAFSYFGWDLCVLLQLAIYYYCAVLRRKCFQQVTGIFRESAVSCLIWSQMWLVGLESLDHSMMSSLYLTRAFCIMCRTAFRIAANDHKTAEIDICVVMADPPPLCNWGYCISL